MKLSMTDIGPSDSKPGPSREYEIALGKMRDAQVIFDEIRRLYRFQKIDDATFLQGRADYKSAEMLFDVVYYKENKSL